MPFFATLFVLLAFNSCNKDTKISELEKDDFAKVYRLVQMNTLETNSDSINFR